MVVLCYDLNYLLGHLTQVVPKRNRSDAGGWKVRPVSHNDLTRPPPPLTSPPLLHPLRDCFESHKSRRPRVNTATVTDTRMLANDMTTWSTHKSERSGVRQGHWQTAHRTDNTREDKALAHDAASTPNCDRNTPLSRIKELLCTQATNALHLVAHLRGYRSQRVYKGHIRQQGASPTLSLCLRGYTRYFT